MSNACPGRLRARRTVKQPLALALGLAAVALLAAACGGASPAAIVHAGTSPGRTSAVKPAATSVAPAAKPATPAVAAASPAPSGPLPVLIIRPPAGSPYGVIEPTGLGLSLDINSQLRDLHWNSWNQSQASGWGDALSDNCNPDCAQGTITRIRITIALSDVVDGHYTYMAWTNGGTINNHLSGSEVYLQLSQGGKKVTGSGISPPSQPPTTAAPASTTPSGAPDYNIPSQLDAAVLASVEQSSHQTVSRVNCVVWPTNAHMFTCTIYFASAGSDIAGVSVAPDGSSYTIESSG
jgi:hypothetical protein